MKNILFLLISLFFILSPVLSNASLIEEKKCSVCHRLSKIEVAKIGPDLFYAGNKFQPTWVIKWLRDTYLTHEKKFNVNKKIFIDRTDSTSKHCQIQNESEVFNYLKNKGFSKYQLTKFSFFEKIYLFSNAEVIVGAHGAAFANLAFCKPKTKVIEIRSYTHPNTVYERISQINDLNYRLIQTKKIDENQKRSGDIYLPIKELERCIINFG